MDFFTFFTLPRKLTLDVPALEKHFYTLSRKLHPDRFAAKPLAGQEAALAQSSLLNDAYRTLKDPILRTQYLLTLEGVELEEQSKAATEAARATGVAKKQIVPPDLLEEAFELNMQLEEMRMAKKMGEDDPQLRKDLLAAKQLFDSKMAATHADLEQLWTKWDAAIDTNDNAAKDTAKGALVALLNRRSYLRNLVRDVNEALEA
nr:Fe-S protein assembly co-chaperone HscB [Granulicella arctica]